MRLLRISRPKGFTIIETMIVLAIAGLILMIVFLAVPPLERNARNNERKHDVSLLTSEIINYYYDNQSLPGGPSGPTGGECFQYNVVPAPGNCPQAATFFENLTKEFSFYKNIDQFFYATDYTEPYFSTWCTSTNYNPTCSGGHRLISSTVFSANDIFIDTSSVCTGNGTEYWSSNYYDVIIAYALESGSGHLNYQCQGMQLHG